MLAPKRRNDNTRLFSVLDATLTELPACLDAWLCRQLPDSDCKRGYKLMSVSSSVNITGLIDRCPLGPLQIRIIVLCGLAALLDGFDLLAIGVAAPVMAGPLHIAPNQFGFVFSAALVCTASAATPQQMLLFRFLAGVGLGGAMPSFISLAAEYTPRSNRQAVIGLLWTGFPLGGVMVGLLASRLINAVWLAVVVLCRRHSAARSVDGVDLLTAR